jgi:long-chain acyl-CoA synthetase
MTVLLEEMVAAHPDAPAVVDGRGATSWAVLDDRVARLVHALRDLGLTSGDRVVTMLGNQAELVEVSLACAHGGWVMVPVNWHWVADEVAYVLADAEATAVVADERWAPVVTEAVGRAPLPTLAARVLVGGGPADGGSAGQGYEDYEALLARAAGGPIADAERGGPMFYTSGTTGRPKGVRSALGRVGGPPELFTLMAHSMRPLLELPPEGGGVQLVCGPMHHSAQWVFGTFALLCGATVVLQHRFDAGELLDLVDEHGVTNLHLVPTQMARLLALPDERRASFDGGSLRAVLHGAAPCPPQVKRRMIEWLGPVVTEYYGGTEGGFLTTISATEWLERPGSVGRAVPIVELVIAGPDGVALPPGETGDVFFRNLMGSDFEYHKAPEKTAAAHAGDGLGTLGDVGHLDDEGYLFLSDRRIDMIVSGGVNIYPTEIEGVLVEHPAVVDAAVFGIPHDEMGEQVHAALELAPGTSWGPDLEAEVLACCAEHLAGYKRPRSFEVHEVLPRNAAGKLTKRVLRDPHWAGRDTAI